MESTLTPLQSLGRSAVVQGRLWEHKRTVWDLVFLSLSATDIVFLLSFRIQCCNRKREQILEPSVVLQYHTDSFTVSEAVQKPKYHVVEHSDVCIISRQFTFP